jgi:hypothetical protein
MAASQQVAFQVARAPSMHLTAQSVDQSSATYTTNRQAEHPLMPEVRLVLNEYIRVAF